MTDAVSILGTCFGLLGIFLSAADTGIAGNLGLQYGALGILGFMIWVNSRERKSMCADIAKKDREILDLFKQQIETSNRMATVAEEMVSVVKNCRAAQIAAQLTSKLEDPDDHPSH